jgi:1-acyl-sn-glycerol-3-phosphate acyltransferase
MREALDRIWRALATGFCFSVFGLGQLLMAVTVFPLMMLLGRNSKGQKRLSRWMIHLAFKGFVELMRVTRVVDYEVEGLERLKRPGLLVLANHPSLIDVVFLISFLPQADCVVKAELFRNLFTRFAVSSAGYIPNDQEPEVVVEACRSSFEAGNSLVVFPEGTRSVPGKPLSLQRGSSRIALLARRDMTPIIIRVGQHNLGKGSKWWHVPKRRPLFHFSVREDIAIAPFLKEGEERSLAARRLTDWLTDYFSKETQANA